MFLARKTAFSAYPQLYQRFQPLNSILTAQNIRHRSTPLPLEPNQKSPVHFYVQTDFMVPLCECLQGSVLLIERGRQMPSEFRRMKYSVHKGWMDPHRGNLTCPFTNQKGFQDPRTFKYDEKEFFFAQELIFDKQRNSPERRAKILEECSLFILIFVIWYLKVVVAQWFYPWALK